MNEHLLSLLIFFPVAVGIPCTLLLPRADHRLQRICGLIILGINMLFSLKLLLPGITLLESHAWIPEFGIRYILDAGPLSIILVLMTTFFSFLCSLGSWNTVMERVREFNIACFLLSAALIGVFTARDFFLFYIFWESILIPMLFIIGIWGGTQRIYAAFKFFLYTFAGSIFMLLGIFLMVYLYHLDSGIWTFGFTELLAAHYTPMLRAVMFGLFFLGFAVKVPLFPFHTWLPFAHVEAPAPGSVMLAGVLLKMGVYGFLAIGIPLMGGVIPCAGLTVMAIAIAGILYGAWVSLAQSDLKKLIAYSSVSHMGFVVCGIFSGTHIGIVGGVLQTLNHAISTGALFFLVGMLYERTHTRQIKNIGGIFRKMPKFAAAFFITLLSSIALPGTNGFVGEFLILLGTFQRSVIAGAIAATGMIFSACYMLWLYQRVFFGKLTYKEPGQLKDLSTRETLVLLPLIILIFWIGLHPLHFLRMIERMPLDYLVRALTGAGV